MKLRELLNEISATITTTGIKVAPADRSLIGVTKFTPEQVAGAIRQKLLVSGYRLDQAATIKSMGGNKYSINSPNINLVATLDNNTGKVDLFAAATQQAQPQPQPVQPVQPQPVQAQPPIVQK
jgi:hypothetical protein